MLQKANKLQYLHTGNVCITIFHIPVKVTQDHVPSTCTCEELLNIHCEITACDSHNKQSLILSYYELHMKLLMHFLIFYLTFFKVFNKLSRSSKVVRGVLIKKVKKVKAEHLYSASSWEPHHRSVQLWSTAFTLQSHHTRLSPRKHSPDGGTMASGSNHLIAAYYSFIDPKGWKAELT